MATFRLSRPLMGIFALSYLSISACIIRFYTFNFSNTSMAQGLATAVATACSTHWASRDSGGYSPEYPWTELNYPR